MDMLQSLAWPVTDIHTHVVPANFPKSMGGLPSPIEIGPSCDCGRADVYLDGRQFRTITNECWDIDRRLEVMGRMGVDRQLLSPMPELLSFWRPEEEAVAIADHVNACLAAMVQRAPERFLALGMVPLQNPDRAISMLETLMASGVFRGVEIGTNIAGAALGDARFHSFFEAAERVGAAIFVHPVRPIIVYPTSEMPALTGLITAPCETALAATSLIAADIPAKFPRLRLAFSHGGGALPLLLPRLDHGWKNTSALHNAFAEPPSAQARRFYYDTLVYDSDSLRFLLHALGKDQLCIGTDLPFAIAERDPLFHIDALGLPPEDRHRLLHGNASRFLGYEAGD